MKRNIFTFYKKSRGIFHYVKYNVVSEGLAAFRFFLNSLEHKKRYNIVIGEEKYIYVLQEVQRDIPLREIL